VFERECQEQATYPYRHLLASLTRLFLIHLVTNMSPAERTALSDLFQTTQLPPSFCPLYGPKIVARPSALAPGEYGQLVQLMSIYTISDHAWATEPVKDRWLALTVAQERLHNVRLRA
jgi:hypothetical protein